MDDSKKAEFRRLLIRVRKTATDIEGEKKNPFAINLLMKTRQSLYGWAERFITDFPELKNEFDTLPQLSARDGSNEMVLQIKALRSFLDSVEDTLAFQDKDKVAEEFLILPGQALTAKKKVGKILQEARKSIKIVDNYLSDDSVEILETTNSQRDIYILTKKKDQKFITAIERMKKGWKGKIEVCLTPTFHDRYLIIDDKIVWHCGPSLDYLGIKKPGVISKLEDTEVVKRIIELFGEAWKSGNKIL